MEYNVEKLHYELVDAGIPIHGCAECGRIDYKNEATKKQKEQGEIIKKVHNSTWYIEQRKAEYPALSAQLDMIYEDKINETNKWVKLITSIKEKYPK